MTKILTGTDVVLTSPPFLAADGFTPAATTATAVVTAVSSAGQTLTVSAVSTSVTGYYTATLQALDDPDLITVTWTGAVSGVDQTLVQEHEVVGGVYLSTFDLYNLSDLDTTKQPLARRIELRDEFEGIAERWVGHAFVRRYAVEAIRYRHGDLLLGERYPVEIVAVTDEDAATVDTVDWSLHDTGLVTDHNVSSDITVKYRYGLTRPPQALVNACKEYVRAKALMGTNRIARDMLSLAGDAGLERYSTPDWEAGRPTGLLDVDRTLRSLGSPLPGVA